VGILIVVIHGNISISYNSCRNRHCPKCQGKTEKIGYKLDKASFSSTLFSCGFTLPDSINVLAMQDPRLVYDFFWVGWATLKSFEKPKKSKLGWLRFAHWGQNLSLHPHLHCIVPGGGVDKNSNWKNIRGDGKFFPVKALSKVLGLICEALQAKSPDNYTRVKKQLGETVGRFAKSLWSPKSVVEYLGRYTHKIHK
jgi:hypothetical protein